MLEAGSGQAVQSGTAPWRWLPCGAGRVWEEEEAGMMVWTERGGGGLQGLGRPPDL